MKFKPYSQKQNDDNKDRRMSIALLHGDDLQDFETMDIATSNCNRFLNNRIKSPTRKTAEIYNKWIHIEKRSV